MRIKKLTQADFREVLEMMRVFYASDALLVHPDEQTLCKTLRCAIEENPYLTGYGFWVGEKLAGYGMVTKSFSTEMGGICVWIEDIYIRPEFRDQGIGTAFLRFVEEQYRQTAARLRLEAEPENERAMAVYRKAGFEILGYTQLVKEMR
jgi:ribosomal protein S18 acetylase RimI-like enzyme